MPDFQNKKTINEIKYKSDILHIGCELKNNFTNKLIKKKNKPIILWNHRWEYDKNPDLFFSILRKIKSMNITFRLIIAGQKFSRSPEIFNSVLSEFKDEIIHSGYCESRDDYFRLLWTVDIIPVTSIQEFFGLSIVEAVYCETYPLLPDRLTYPEIFSIDENPEIFYKNESELLQKLIDALKNHKNLNNYSSSVIKYDWRNMVDLYDETFSEML